MVKKGWPSDNLKRSAMAGNNNHSRLGTKLDKGIQALLGKGPADYPPDSWRRIREHLRLQVLYPGRFVLFRDHYQEEGEHRWLIQREVLATFRTMAAVQKWLAPLSDEQRLDLCVEYVEREPVNWV
jgi:hypothetical protein